MKYDSTYHEGELEIQARTGASEKARLAARSIQDRIPATAIHFVAQQVMAIVGSLDTNGNVWASILLGKPGFLHTKDGHFLHLQRSICHSAPGDPLWENLKKDPQLGILLIELVSRRRLRVNGKAHPTAGGDYLIEVYQAYANCPKYIQRRRLNLPDTVEPTAPPAYQEGRQLNDSQQAWICNADTFFVASAHPVQGVDASHRGGYPGFVEVLNPNRLRIPDFAGNSMFNTLGNFSRYPHAGLVFIDFERGHLLQLCGRPAIFCDGAVQSGESVASQRCWEFEVEAWCESKLPIRLEWHFLDYSPYIPATQEPDDQTDERL